jgi:hypothetical protein
VTSWACVTQSEGLHARRSFSALMTLCARSVHRCVTTMQGQRHNTGCDARLKAKRRGKQSWHFSKRPQSPGKENNTIHNPFLLYFKLTVYPPRRVAGLPKMVEPLSSTKPAAKVILFVCSLKPSPARAGTQSHSYMLVDIQCIKELATSELQVSKQDIVGLMQLFLKQQP